MNFFPSQRMPPLDWSKVDWKLKAAVGKEAVAGLWESLWREGCAVGRAEGVVGTLLVVLMICVVVLAIVTAIKGGR